jgi:hypothetical protein
MRQQAEGRMQKAVGRRAAGGRCQQQAEGSMQQTVGCRQAAGSRRQAAGRKQ